MMFVKGKNKEMAGITFGENLRRFRIKQLLTQKEVANILKISRQSISKWETNQALPTLDLLVPLTTVLNGTLDDLLQVHHEKM